MLNLTTPTQIDASVITFCEEISPLPPLYLELDEPQGMKLSDCFNNVAKHVASNGGNIQHGWIIWYAEGQFIEAEFHAVWVDADGAFQDITPKNDGEKRILFLPDDTLEWNKNVIPNKRKALRDDPLVHLVIEQGHAMDEIKRRHVNENGEIHIPAQVFMAHQQESARKTMMLMQSMSGRQQIPEPSLSKNRKCPCGSGSKYKHCGMKGRCNQ